MLSTATNTPAIKNPARVLARRSALISAAIEIFSERGYHASRVSDIAAAAGVSQGTVYNYVQSKEDFLYLICEDHFLGYTKIVEAALDGVTDPKERLDALLKATIEGVFSYRKHYLVMLRELHNIERSQRREFLKLAAIQREMCQEILLDIARHEPMIVPNPLITANILVYLPKLIVSRGWDLKGKVEDEKVAAEILGFMRRGLGLSSD